LVDFDILHGFRMENYFKFNLSVNLNI